MFLLGVMVGAIQIPIAVFKLGDLTRYISESVILGFMLGAALLLAVGQIANLLGVRDRGTGDQNILYRLWLTLTRAIRSTRTPSRSASPPSCWRCCCAAGARLRLPQLDMLAALVAVAAAAFLLGWSLPGADGKTAIADRRPGAGEPAEPHIPRIKFAWIRRSCRRARSPSLFSGCWKRWPSPSRSPSRRASRSTITASAWPKGSPIWSAGSSAACRARARCRGRRSISRPGRRRACRASSPPLGVALAVLLLAPLTRFIPKAALAGLLVITAARLIDIPRLRYAFAATRYDAGLVVITALVAIFVGVEYVDPGRRPSVDAAVRAARVESAGGELVVSPERVVRERLPADPPTATSSCSILRANCSSAPRPNSNAISTMC